MLIYEVGSDDANVPILRVLCSRRYTAVTVENWTPPTSKTDSARKFGLDRMLELWLLFISWPIMPCKVRMDDNDYILFPCACEYHLCIGFPTWRLPLGPIGQLGPRNSDLVPF